MHQQAQQEQMNNKTPNHNAPVAQKGRTLVQTIVIIIITGIMFLLTYVIHLFTQEALNNILTALFGVLSLSTPFILIHSFAKSTKVDLLINYISLDRYWMEWVKWKLGYSTLVLKWDDKGHFKKKLQYYEKEAKRVLSIVSTETLALLEKPEQQRFFHDLKKRNRWSSRSRMNAILCVRNNAYTKLCDYDNKLTPLNFTDGNKNFIPENEAENELASWLTENGQIPQWTGKGDEKPRYPGDRPSSWKLSDRNHDFSGRMDLLAQLQKQLASPQARVLLYGLAGSGKTEIAREYAYRNSDRYSHIFWLDIETSQYRTQINEIVTVLNILPKGRQSNEDAFIDWLRHQDGSLLIIDGYQNSEKINIFLNRSLKGKLLVTAPTKITRANIGSGWEVIEVGGMNKEDAMNFMIKHTLTEYKNLTTMEEENIITIIKTLGYMPEALLAAGLYIGKSEHPDFGKYIKAYDEVKRKNAQQIQKQEQRLAKEAKGETIDIIYSWWLYFNEVQVKYPKAAKILKYCTMLDPTTIHREIIENIPGLFLESDEWSIRIKQLHNYFLIHGNEDTLSIDPHIKNFFRDWLDKNTKKELSIDIIQALSKTLEFTSIPNMRRKRAQAYAIQFDTCKELIREYKIEQLKVADLYDSYGHYLAECAEYKEAGELLDESWKMRRQFDLELQNGVMSGITQDELDLKKATNRSHKAELLYAQGKYVDANQTLETQVLLKRKKILGKYHVEVATTYYHLARLASILDETRIEFNALCLRLATIWLQMPISTLSKNNAVTLLKQQGSIYYMQRDYRESIKKYDEAITIATEALEDHQVQGLEKNAFRIEIEICEARKGRCYIALREAQQYGAAESAYIRLEHTYTETFNVNRHPEIAQIYLGFAELGQMRHDDGLAKHYYEKARDIYNNIQEDHPQIKYINSSIKNLSYKSSFSYFIRYYLDYLVTNISRVIKGQ